jgi:predicted nucleotidyltransferase
MTTDPYIEKLRALKPQFKEMNIKRLRVFGSRARGDAQPGSDIDLLVDFDRRIGLVGYAGVKRELEKRLEIPVDLLMEASLYEEIRERALKEAVDV